MTANRTHLSARLLLLACVLCSCSAQDDGSFRGQQSLLPEAGLSRFQARAALPVPGGTVNLAGGNLLVRRVELSIDTRIGIHEVTATWNSATKRWLWSFEMTYNGARFVDASGAEHSATSAQQGRLLAGSSWFRQDASRVRSAGGLVHEFDSAGRLAAIHWRSGAHPRLEFLAGPVAGGVRTTAVRQCRAAGVCEPVYAVEYDASGRVAAIADRAGRRAELAWDLDGRLLQARDPLDVERGWPGFRYGYEPKGGLVSVTSSENERIEYETHEPSGQIRRVLQRGVVHGVHVFHYGKYAYASADETPDRWTEYVDPFGRRTLHLFDGLRRLHKVIRANGERSIWSWLGLEVVRHQEPDGRVTEWERVSDDETLRRDPGGNQVRTVFRTDGGENRAEPFRRPVERIEDSLGLVEERHYEGDRLVWIENGAGERTSLAYGAENQLWKVTDPAGNTTRFEDYGEHGHPQRVVSAGETEIRSYDAVGNLLAREGAQLLDLRPGGERSRRFDADRNPMEIALSDAPAAGAPEDGVVAIEWRSDGRPLRIARPFGGDHEFVYDVAGRLVERRERVDGAWQSTHFEVDAIGRVTAVTLPNGMRRETGYDELGRLRQLRSLRNGVLESRAVFEHVAGQLTSLSDDGASGAELYGWDSAGRPVAVTFPEGERLELEWDLRGRLAAETWRWSDGSVLRRLSYAYDAADRNVRVEEDGEIVLERVYAEGRLVEEGYGNGLRLHVAYDGVRGLPVLASLEHPIFGLVAASTVELAPAPEPDSARLVLATSTAGPSGAASREEYVLGPRAAGGPRVVSWSDGVETRTSAFDLLANQVESQGGANVHFFNAERNRLLRIEAAATGATLVDYVYDAAGYTTMRAGEAIAWTAAGRIAALGERASFAWDALGRPTRRVQDGSERHFRFGGRLETDSAGAPLRLDLGSVVLELAEGTRRYRHPDLRGNIKLVTDDSGQVAAHFVYDAFGLVELHGEDDEARSFAGGRGLGDLVVLGPRLHDSLAGRFLAPDPVLQDLSQFTYTQGNTVWWWDPDGLQASQRIVKQAVVNIALGSVMVAGGVVVILYSPVPPALKLPIGGALIAMGINNISSGTAELVTELLHEEKPRGGSNAGSPSWGRGTAFEPGIRGGPPGPPEGDFGDYDRIRTPTADGNFAIGGVAGFGGWGGFGGF